MRRRPALVRVVLIGLSTVGIALGHGFTYAGLEPRGVAREAWLAATGHGYLPTFVAVATAVALAIGAAAVLRGILAPRPEPRLPLARLAAFEMAGFVLMETLERVASGAGFADLPRVLPVGLAIQSAIACLLAVAVRWLHRAGTAVARRRSPSPAPARGPVALLPTVQHVLVGVSGRGTLGDRAPPITS